MRKVELNLPTGVSGDWELKKFTITPEGEKMHNLGEMINGRNRFIEAGEYYGLYCDGKIIMSNTPAEVNDHYKFIQKAQGKVLIGGLGLGMVLKCLLDKNDVTKVVVVEQSPDVIKLVASSYTNDPRVEIVNESIFEYKPNEKFDCAWFDIWDDISGEEYPEMKKVASSFRKVRRVVRFMVQKSIKKNVLW